MEDRVKPDCIRALESDDPDIHDALCSGVPLDELQLPPDPLPAVRSSSAWTAEDLEVIRYLKVHHFSLQPRWEFVAKSVERLRAIVERQEGVTCPKCGGPIALEQSRSL
jgi:hypothetical protein